MIALNQRVHLSGVGMVRGGKNLGEEVEQAGVVKGGKDKREGHLSPSSASISVSLPVSFFSACHLCSVHIRRLSRSAGRASKILFLNWFNTKKELQWSLWTNFVASKPTKGRRTMWGWITDFFTYETTKSVVVKSWLVGTINRFVQLLIIVYFVWSVLSLLILVMHVSG